MKKKISLLLAILMLVTFIPTSFAERKTTEARKSNQRIALDGEEVKVGSYLVEDYNYIKLRDVAAILKGTSSQFNVGRTIEDKSILVIDPTSSYDILDSDLQEITKEKAKASLGITKVEIRGEIKELKTALIDGFNYVQLRDIAKLVGFEVGYDAKNKTILINTSKENKYHADSNIKKVPESEWTEAEKEWFNDRKTYLSNMVLVAFGFATADGPNIEQIKQKYIDNLAISIFGGRKLFEGPITSQSNKVEIRDGVRYSIATCFYESGASVEFEGQNIGQENEFWRTNFYNTVILTYAGALSEQYKKDKKAVCDQLIKFHDAIADKDYEKAVKEIKELNIYATVESVKLFEERMREYSKNLPIFNKEYSIEYITDADNDDDHVIFRYKNNLAFKLSYMGTNCIGILGGTNKGDN